MTASRTMDADETLVSQRRATRQMPWAAVAVTVWLLGYAIFMATRFVPALSEPDDNGYFAQGSLLATTGRTWFKAESDAQYIGMHWLLTPDGKYVSRYPPGLAVLIAGVEKVAGWRGAALVNPLMALAGLVGFYLIGRRIVGPWWAVAGVVLLGAMPEYMHHGLGFDSHTGVAFCVIWGLYFLLRWWDEQKAWQAFAAGLVLGCIPTVRYPDVVMGLGVAAFLLVVGRGKWRHIAAAVAGAMLPVAALAIRNHLVMGAFWRTGYALTHEQTGFSWAYFREHAIDYVRTLNSSGVGPVFALGVVGMVWMIASGGRRRWLGVMLAGMTVPMVLLYMAYYWAPGGGMGGGAMTMRFMVPTFAAYVLAGVWVIAQLVRTARPAAQAAVGVTLVGLQLLWGTTDVLQQADRSRATKDGLVRVTDALERTAARGSVIVADQGVLQHLDYVREWKLADASLVRGGGGGPGGMMRGGPGGFFGAPPNGEEESERPSPRQAEKDEARRAKYAGSTRERQNKFAADLVDWAGGAKVYLVGSEQEMKTLLGTGRVRVVERIKLPEPPLAGPGRQGTFGRGGMMPGMRGQQAGGMRRMGAGMFGGPGGPGAGPPMGGGPGGGLMGGFGALTEVVIAEWNQ